MTQSRDGRRRFLARVEPADGVRAAGEIVASTARMGRLVTRAGWRMARAVPGAGVVLSAAEAQTARIRHAATAEFLRMLELPQQLAGAGTAGAAELRALLLVQEADPQSEPLRSAMNELLDRAGDPDRTRSREYLFGTIVSQLVPDEARILATLAPGRPFALVDVVAKRGRSPVRPVLSDMSTVGAAAGIANLANTSTYVGRLRQFGLLDVAPRQGDELADQFDALERNEAVLTARAGIDGGRATSRIVRQVVRLSSFGAEFWAACSPTRAAFADRPR